MKISGLIAAVLSVLLCLSACEKSPDVPSDSESFLQVDDTSIHNNDSETDPVIAPIITKAALSADETIFYRKEVPASSWEMIFCTSAEEKYSIYVTRTYMTDENRLYTKMELTIPPDIAYDDYKLLPAFMTTGGSGGAMILIEFTAGETKTYYAFEANLAEYKKSGWNRFFGYRMLTEEEISEVLKVIEEKGELE